MAQRAICQGSAWKKRKSILSATEADKPFLDFVGHPRPLPADGVGCFLVKSEKQAGIALGADARDVLGGIPSILHTNDGYTIVARRCACRCQLGWSMVVPGRPPLLPHFPGALAVTTPVSTL